MLKDRLRAVDGHEPLWRSRELCAKNRQKSVLDPSDLMRLRRATAMARPKPPSNRAVGDVWRIGPIDDTAVDVERFGDCAKVALIIDAVGCGESAVDVEDRELLRINTSVLGANGNNNSKANSNSTSTALERIYPDWNTNKRPDTATANALGTATAISLCRIRAVSPFKIRQIRLDAVDVAVVVVVAASL